MKRICVLLMTMLLLAPASYALAVSQPTDIARSSGLWDGVKIRSYGAYPMDWNADGLRDVLIVPHVTTGGRLFRNKGDGTFALAWTLPRKDRHGCDAADVNLDGLPDIYCTLGADGGTATKSNELWIQTASGVFSNQAVAWGVDDPYGRGREVTFLDVNHDAYPDLYVTNAYPRADGIPSPNRLYVNQGGTRFRDATEYGLDVEVGGTLGTQTCVQRVDVNGDGWDDLLVCGKYGLRMYVNQAGSFFVDRRAELGLPGGIYHDAMMADMNGDGALDFAGVNKRSTGNTVVALRQSNGPFAIAWSATAASVRQLEATDLDADGDRDIYVVRGSTYADVVYDNAGSGKAFGARTMPIVEGDGQSVRAFDVDQDRRDELIVMNGTKTVYGTVQVWKFS